LHRDVQSIAPDAVCTTRDLRTPNSAHQSDPPKRLRVKRSPSGVSVRQA
jgi:hypothetical protein